MLRLPKAHYLYGRGKLELILIDIQFSTFANDDIYQGQRDESNLVNMTLVQEDVVALYEAGNHYL